MVFKRTFQGAVLTLLCWFDWLQAAYKLKKRKRTKNHSGYTMCIWINNSDQWVIPTIRERAVHPSSDGSHSSCPGQTGRARQTWRIANIKGAIISERSQSVTTCSLSFPPKLPWQFCSFFSALGFGWQFPNALLPPMDLTEVSAVLDAVGGAAVQHFYGHQKINCLKVLKTAKISGQQPDFQPSIGKVDELKQ